MAELRRTTGGLLELQTKSFSREAFRGTVRVVESMGISQSTLDKLGVAGAKRFIERPATAMREFTKDSLSTTESGEVLDVQRNAHLKR